MEYKKWFFWADLNPSELLATWFHELPILNSYFFVESKCARYSINFEQNTVYNVFPNQIFESDDMEVGVVWVIEILAGNKFICQSLFHHNFACSNRNMSFHIKSKNIFGVD